VKEYKIEIENEIEYVVITLNIDDIQDWKKFVKENYDLVKNPNFKFIFVSDDNKIQFILYTNKYKFHNLHGPSFIGEGKEWYLDDVKYETEEEYINAVRKRILDEILDGND
jgi:hypothetical protein